MANSDFAKQDKLTSFFTDLITNEIKRRNLETFEEVFNPCEITQCDRRILYRAEGYPKEIGEEQKVSNWLQQQTNKALKDKWLAFFSSCVKVNSLDRDVIRADTNYNLYSVIDAILKIGDLSLVLTIKPVNKDDFQKVVKEGAFRKHVVEQMVNMWLAEISNGILLYGNLDSGTYLLFHVTPYQPLLHSISRKCENLRNLKLKGQLAPRVYKVKSKECFSCEFNQRCWKAENQ